MEQPKGFRPKEPHKDRTYLESLPKQDEDTSPWDLGSFVFDQGQSEIGAPVDQDQDKKDQQE